MAQSENILRVIQGLLPLTKKGALDSAKNPLMGRLCVIEAVNILNALMQVMNKPKGG